MLHVKYYLKVLIQINNEQVASDNGNSACDKAQGHMACKVFFKTSKDNLNGMN